MNTEFRSYDSLYNFNFIPTPETPTKYIRVNLHVIQDENGENNFIESNTDHINYIESIFSKESSESVNGVLKNIHKLMYSGDVYDDPYIPDSRLAFTLQNIYFHQDNGGLADINHNSHATFGNYCEANYGINMATEFNVFLIPYGYHPVKPSTDIEGYGPSGTSSSNPQLIGKVLIYNVFYDYINNGGSTFIVNPLIAHEFGHVFGLKHTNDYSGSYRRFHDDLPWPEDFYWCQPNIDANCSNNIMSYSAVKRYLSPKQIGHIHRVLSSNPVRMRYLESFPNNPDYNVVISTNTVWDMATVAQGDIIIETGKTLEITCLLSMLKDTRIIIRPGGKLIVDGGIITNPLGDLWQGIYVEGDRTKPQNFENQGALVLKNGAIIENAKNAVTTQNTEDNWWGNGGIIQATDAIFRNNRRNVEFLAYQNLDVNNNEISNISFFRGVTFETTSDTPHDSHISNVSMWSVKGVRFSSCVFRNSSTKNRDGILAYDASFNVNQCSFTGLQYSIYSQSPNSNNTFNITNSTFNCYRGIYMNIVDNVQIRNNTFYVQPSFSFDINDDCSDANYGIYINYSTNYRIENNHFEVIARPPLFTPTCGPVGIVLRHTGDFTNELYRNEFSGLMIGIQAQGNNKGFNNDQGLFLHCNNLNKNYYDFHVKYVPRSRMPGIRELQGYGQHNASLAGNLFGHDQSVLLSNFVVDNECGNISYFHHNPESEPRVVPLIYSEDKITLWSNLNNDYIENISCPDKVIAVKTYEEVVLEKDYSLSKYEETTLSLRALVDAGNSNDLKRSIEDSGPAPNNSLYNYLMEIAPFLSEDVLAVLAAKERGFTNVMIRNVLVKSPQAPKLDMVVEKLNNRNIPLPPPMRKKIDEGLDYFGEKELLEQEQAFYKTNYELALNEIIINKIQETEGWEDAPAVEDILASIDDVRYKYLLAEQLFEKGEYDQGMQLLSSIDDEYSVLESNSAENHLDYISFYSLLQQVNLEESPGYLNLSPEILESLESFIDSDSRVAGKAIAILLMNEAIEYNEPLYFPELENEIKSETAYEFTEFDSSDFVDVDNMGSVYLYPNPAQANISINWCVEEEKSLNATIDIYNSNGTLIYSNSERSGCSSLNISVSGWMSGTYTAIFNYGTESKNINFIIAN